jgi:hypothetical protein
MGGALMIAGMYKDDKPVSQA